MTVSGSDMLFVMLSHWVAGLGDTSSLSPVMFWFFFLTWIKTESNSNLWEASLFFTGYSTYD